MYKKKILNNYGFTLMELIGVIIIVAIVVAIAFPNISRYILSSRTNTYNMYEENLETATANMMSVCLQKNTPDCIPESGGSKTVSLSDLISLQYIERLKDPEKDGQYCNETDSYVVVTNSGSSLMKLEYAVCLKCSNYQSEKC